MDIGSVHKPVTLDLHQGGRQAVSGASASAKPAASVQLPVDGKADQPSATGQLQDAVATLQEFAQSVQRNLNFSVDDGSGRVVVKVTDANSGDVIRQIPSEEALQLAEHLAEASNLLFKAKA